MSQETEYSGDWWLPSNPDRRVTGRLDLNGPILELTLDAALLPPGGAEQDFPVIHGSDKGGFELTLLGAYSIRDWPIGNWYVVNDALVGGHLSTAEANFAEASVVMDHLADWIPASGIEMSRTQNAEPGEKALEVTYTVQAPLEGRITDGTDVRISTSPRIEYALGRGITVGYGAGVRWKYRNPLPTHEIVAQHVAPLQELVAWAVQQPVTVTAAYLRVQPDQEPMEWRRRWRKARESGEESRVGNTRFFASDLAPTFADGLQRWLGLLNQSTDAVDLMVSLLFSAPEYADTAVLLVAQSLEAYHRTSLEKERWPGEIFEQRQHAVLSRFKDEEDRDLKTWLDEVLKFANGPTLAERLGDLHAKAEPVIGDLLALRPLWADRLKKMRNTYSHRGKQSRKYQPDELKEIARLGRIVFDVCLMLDLGLSVDTCRERVHQWSDYSFAMHDARKHHEDF
jgi:ApeA N-terminal domain 1